MNITRFSLIMVLSCALIMVSTETRVNACSAFKITSDKGTFVGNNEDWTTSNPTIKFYPQKRDKGKGEVVEFGRMYIAYWWVFFWMPFAGINENGLMFDIFLTDTPNWTSGDWLKSLRLGLSLATKAMKSCENVEQVVELFRKHNVVMPGHQLFFTDKEGNSVVIGGGEFVFPPQGRTYQAVTNHLLFSSDSESEDMTDISESQSRLNKVNDALENLQNTSLEELVTVCKNVSKSVYNDDGEQLSAPTRYTYVIDFENLKMYLFRLVDDHAVDYENAAVLDILNELGKPRHSFQLNSLEFLPVEDIGF